MYLNIDTIELTLNCISTWINNRKLGKSLTNSQYHAKNICSLHYFRNYDDASDKWYLQFYNIVVNLLGSTLEVIVSPNIVGATNPFLQFLITDLNFAIPHESKIYISFGQGISLSGHNFHILFANQTLSLSYSVSTPDIVISGFDAINSPSILMQIQGYNGSYISFLQSTTHVYLGIYNQGNQLEYVSCIPFVVPAALGN